MRFRTIKLDKEQHWCLTSVVRAIKLNTTFVLGESCIEDMSILSENLAPVTQGHWDSLWSRFLPIEVALFNAYSLYVKSPRAATVYLTEQSYSDLKFFMDQYDPQIDVQGFLSEESKALVRRIEAAYSTVLDAIEDAGFVDTTPTPKDNFSSFVPNTYAN